MTSTKATLVTAQSQFLEVRRSPFLSKYTLTPPSEHADTAFTQERVQILTQQIADHIQASLEWIVTPEKPNAPITMLDYACDNGAASKVCYLI